MRCQVEAEGPALPGHRDHKDLREQRVTGEIPVISVHGGFREWPGQREAWDQREHREQRDLLEARDQWVRPDLPVHMEKMEPQVRTVLPGQKVIPEKRDPAACRVQLDQKEIRAAREILAPPDLPALQAQQDQPELLVRQVRQARQVPLG